MDKLDTIHFCKVAVVFLACKVSLCLDNTVVSTRCNELDKEGM